LQVQNAATQALNALYAKIAVGGLDLNQLQWREGFGYDANANRVMKSNAWGDIAYSYNAENQLLSAGNRTYSNDLNGNMVSESLGSITAQYRYTADNRLKNAYSAVKGFMGVGDTEQVQATGAQYAYDALGRRVKSSRYDLVNAVPVVVPGSKLMNWYDGLSMDVMQELAFTAAGKYELSSEFVKNGRAIVSKTEFNLQNPMLEKTLTKEYFQDTLGSTIAIKDALSNVTAFFAYDAFGNNFGDMPGGAGEYLYTGKLFDRLTGLSNFGFRDYQAHTGRFTTLDPIRDGLNWYVLCGNDPVNYVDLLGLCSAPIEKTSDKFFKAAGAMALTGLAATQIDPIIIGPGDIAGVVIEIVAIGSVSIGGMVWIYESVSDALDVPANNSPANIKPGLPPAPPPTPDPNRKLKEDIVKVTTNVAKAKATEWVLDYAEKRIDGGSGKNKAVINTIDDLLANAGKLEKLKGGVRQGFLEGDAKLIIENLANNYNVKLQKNGNEFYFESDDLRVGLHNSTATNDATIHINNAGKLYKIRVK